MNKRVKTVLLALGISIMPYAVWANQEPGKVPPEAEVSTEANIDDYEDINVTIENYLNEKGWVKGENTKQNGDSFYIAVGTGVIQANSSNRHFPASRVAAYNKAMLAAKQQMVNYIGMSIQSSTASVYSEGEFPQPPVPQPDESSMLYKIKKLIHAKLDKALRAEGIDPDKAKKEELEQAMKKQLSSESYAKFISTSAQAYVCGMQAYRVFETTPANSKGQIAVIAIWSPKLQQMAETLQTGSSMPKGMPKKSIKEQIPKAPEALLLTFGVQQKLNEKGELVLVAFGQEGARTDSPRSANAAYSKAYTNAVAAIREFAGENVATATDILNAETTEEFENAAEEYNNTSAFREKITAIAAKMEIKGISEIYRKAVKHPISGKNIYIVVCAWSPSSAQRAQTLMNNSNNATKSPTVQQQNTVNESELNTRSFSGAGAEADEDAF